MDFDSRYPIYEQLINLFKLNLIREEYRANDLLPSRRDLANQYRINPNTVQKAFKELENQGYIVTDGNSQSRVISNQERIEALKKEHLNQALKDFFSAIQSLGLGEDEVHQVIEEYWGKNND